MKLTDLQEATHHRLNYIEWIIDVWKEDGDDQIEVRNSEGVVEQLISKFGQPDTIFNELGEPDEDVDEGQGHLYEWIIRDYFKTGRDVLYQILFYPYEQDLIAGTFLEKRNGYW
jgi:hypothetical protein